MAEEEKQVVENENNTQTEQAVAGPDPIFLSSQEFSGLLNVLLVNTKFFVATELKEKPKYDGDASVYLINLLVNNPIINLNSDLVQLLSRYSNNIQIINNPDLKGYHTVGVEVYVKETVKEPIEAETESE